MTLDSPVLAASAADLRSIPPDSRLIARGEGWSVSEHICRAGPGQRPFEERHDWFVIAAVAEGSFNYRSDGGRSLLHPGAFLLGNAGACYECGHEHGVGDRCLSLNFAPEFFGRLSASAAGGSGFRFASGMAPAAKRTTPLIAGLEAMAQRSFPFELEESVIRIAERVVAAASGARMTRVRVSAREERRVADALRYIEDRAEAPLTLDELASAACVSKYHFLRIFHRLVGMTPYQFLLSLRIRRVAAQLAGGSRSVSSIAFDAGFGDLSTFNARFRQHFGMSPIAYRRNCGTPALGLAIRDDG